MSVGRGRPQVGNVHPSATWLRLLQDEHGTVAAHGPVTAGAGAIASRAASRMNRPQAASARGVVQHTDISAGASATAASTRAGRDDAVRTWATLGADGASVVDLERGDQYTAAAAAAATTDRAGAGRRASPTTSSLAAAVGSGFTSRTSRI